MLMVVDVEQLGGKAVGLASHIAKPRATPRGSVVQIKGRIEPADLLHGKPQPAHLAAGLQQVIYVDAAIRPRRSARCPPR